MWVENKDIGIGLGKSYWIWYLEKNPTHPVGYFGGNEAAAGKANAISRIHQQNLFLSILPWSAHC